MYVRCFSSAVVAMFVDCYDLCCNFTQVRIFLFLFFIDRLRETVGEICTLNIEKAVLTD